jgi:hypothetical protein
MRRASTSRSLRHARWQSVLAVAAIASAVSLPVILVSVGGGVDAHEIASLEQTGYQVVVSAQGLHGIEGAHQDSAKLLALPNVVAVEPILSIAIDLFNRTGNVSAAIAEGIVPSQFGATLSPTERGLFSWPLALGDPNDTEHYADGAYDGPTSYDVLLSAPYAQMNQVTVGSTVVLSPTTNASLGVRYNVTGLFGPQGSLFEPAGAFAALVLLSNLQVLTDYARGSHTVVPDGADTIEVVVAPSTAESPSGLAGVEREVQAVLPSYTVTSVSSEAAELRSADGILTGFYLALSSVGLAVGLLFLALVLVRRVERDRRSIGIRRAIGLPQRSVAASILEDGAILAAAGGTVGVVAGVVVVEGLATWASSTVKEAAQLAIFAPAFLGELVVGVVALSVAASAAAVHVAWRVDLLEALR